MKNLLILTLIVVYKICPGQDLPTANSIIEKYIVAIGGRENINKIQDITINTMTETPRGASETELKFKQPNKFSMSVYANGMEIMNNICDGSKIKYGGMMGGNRPSKEGKEAEAEAMMINPFAEMNYNSLGIVGQVQGIEKLGETEAYKVEFSQADGKKFTVWFDKDSGLKLKTFSSNETPRGIFETTTTFANYKKFKGTEILIPSKTTRNGGQMGELVSEVQSVKVNKGLEDKAFEIK